MSIPPRKEYRPVQRKNPPKSLPPKFYPPKDPSQNLSQPPSKPKNPTHLVPKQAKIPSHSSNRFSVLGDQSLPKEFDPSNSSLLSHMAHLKPMDDSFDQDNLLDEEDVIEVDSDDGATVDFVNQDSIPSKVYPMTTQVSENMKTTPSGIP